MNRQFTDWKGNPRKCATCTNFRETKTGPHGVQGECRANPPTTTMFLLQAPPQAQSNLMLGGQRLNAVAPPQQIQMTFYPLVNAEDVGCSLHDIVDDEAEAAAMALPRRMELVGE